MGTNGLFGVINEGKEKVTYNHWDSDPPGLGLSIVSACRRIQKDFANYRARAAKLKLVGDDKMPTETEIKKLERFCDESIGGRTKTEWYCLLRGLQGDLLGTLDAGYMIDSRSFAADSLLCEWGYIVNFDNQTLECYRGFVTANPEGRFKDDETDSRNEYQPIHLLGEFHLERLPDDKKFIAQIEEWYDESCKLFGESPQYADAK